MYIIKIEDKFIGKHIHIDRYGREHEGRDKVVSSSRLATIYEDKMIAEAQANRYSIYGKTEVLALTKE